MYPKCNYDNTMTYFDSDYMVGAHPEVLARLVETNMLHTPGYGHDAMCAEARQTILDVCGIVDGEVFFLEGGTQTNAIVLDRLLDHNDGVIAAETSHINVHEAGAVEATGHKVIALSGCDGKLSADNIENYLKDFYADSTHVFMVRPGAVYISYPTELGTLYSREELHEIHEICRRYSIPLYIDGARLAYALGAAPDLTLRDIASMCEVFYIGGTKCGALLGEAVVSTRRLLLPRFESLIKLHGATMAKGRILGVQFQTLMAGGLYERIGRHGVEMAKRVRKLMTGAGYPVYIDSPTNQQFFVLPNNTIDSLFESGISFELWGARGMESTPVRFVTDWATTSGDIDSLALALAHCKK